MQVLADRRQGHVDDGHVDDDQQETGAENQEREPALACHALLDAAGGGNSSPPEHEKVAD